MKIKRGIEVTIISTGETAFMERDRQDGTVLVRDTQNETAQTVYFDTTIDNITLARKGSTGIKNSNKPKTDKQKTESEELNEFFDKMALKMPYNCMECDKPLYASNKFAKRSCTAHIFPKAQFKSIATNENNIFFLGPDLLGVCDDHDSWDRKGAEYRKKMKIYPYALQQFKILRGSMTDKEIVQAYSYLGVDWQ